MTLREIEAYLNELSESVGDIFNVPVSLNGRLTRKLGRAWYVKNKAGYCTPEKIEFSKRLVDFASDDDIKNIVAHEWAHYYDVKINHMSHGHDSEFKRICAMVGCTADEPKANVDSLIEETSLKYSIYCENCGYTGGRSRMNKVIKNIEGYRCGKCNGKLFYKQNW